MRTRTTLSLVLVAALLGAFVLFYEIKQPGTDERRAAEGLLFSDLSLAQITRMDMERPGENVTLERENGLFRITAPIDDRADTAHVEDLLRGILAIRAKAYRSPDTITGGDEATGLGAGALRAVLHTGEGQRTLEIGARAIGGGLRFLRTRETDKLALVSEQDADLLATPLADLRDRKVFDLAPLETGSLSISAGVQEQLRLSRRGPERWWVEFPFVDEADPAEVHQLLSELSALRADRFLPEDSKRDTGFDHPTMVFAAMGRGDDPISARLELGAEAAPGTGRYFVRQQGRQAEFEIYLAPLLRDLEQGPERWRSRRILDFSPWDVVEVGLTRDARSVQITRVEGETEAATSWTAIEPTDFPVDGRALISLLTQLSDVRAFETSAPGLIGEIQPVAKLELFFRDIETSPPVILEIGSIEEDKGVWVRKQGRQTLLLMDSSLADKIDPAQVETPPTQAPHP